MINPVMLNQRAFNIHFQLYSLPYAHTHTLRGTQTHRHTHVHDFLIVSAMLCLLNKCAFLPTIKDYILPGRA